MKFPKYEYIEVAFGGVNNRNVVKKASEVKVPRDKPDCYRTVYRYREEFLSYFKQNNSVKGFNGDVYADFLPIDVDNEDLAQAQKETKHLLNTLLNAYEVDLDKLKIYFSGAKGFHVLIPAAMFNYTPHYYMPQAFKVVAPKLAEGIRIDGAIYDRVRLFRFSNTINSKTGLYKVPLTAAEILHKSIEEIKAMAAAPRTVDQDNHIGVNNYLAELYNEALREVQRDRDYSTSEPLDQNKVRPPKYAKLCYYKIMEGVGEGHRDNAGLRLANHWLKEFPADMVLPMMQAWNRRNMPPLELADLEKVFKQGAKDYDYGCNDSVLAEFCDPACVLKGRQEQARVTADKIYTLDEAKNKYLEYIAKLDQLKINLGFEKLDRNLRGIAPGEVCEVMARTGVGKTAFLLNVINNVIVNQKVPVLFFSLEQPLAQIYERTAQIANFSSGYDIETDYKDEMGANISHELTKKNFSGLYVVDQDYLTYEELKEFVQVAETEKIGRRPPLICVDYLGRMKGGRGNAYEVTSELAKLLKVLAKELDVAVLYLHQTSRAGGTGKERISLDMARDSGVVEEAADFIIGMWRPEIDCPEAQKRDHEEIMVALLKNRKGRIGEVSYRFTKKYLRIQPWEDFEEPYVPPEVRT